tara:strand:+ start:355 stop:609 length:255 start_codon:yes stop_codon:yes gene_type:complete
MMPSLPKLIALALVVWTVWKVFRVIERRKEVARDETGESTGPNSSEQTFADTEKKNSSLDLEECPKCGSWVILPCKCKNPGAKE